MIEYVLKVMRMDWNFCVFFIKIIFCIYEVGFFKIILFFSLFVFSEVLESIYFLMGSD